MEDAKTNSKHESRCSTPRGLGIPRQAREGLATPLVRGDISYKDIPKNFKLLKRANELRKAGFLHEVMLWEKLKGKQMCGLTFHRQQVIGNYIVDFVCYKICLIIEADGASHKGKEEYDKNRDIYLKNSGFNILHIPVKEIFLNMNNVIKKIKDFIKDFT